MTLTLSKICYIISLNGSALMALPDKPFPAMLMAERERTNPSRGVLLRVLAF